MAFISVENRPEWWRKIRITFHGLGYACPPMRSNDARSSDSLKRHLGSPTAQLNQNYQSSKAVHSDTLIVEIIR